MQDACTELEVHCDWKGPIKISTDDMVDVINTGLLKKSRWHNHTGGHQQGADPKRK